MKKLIAYVKQQASLEEERKKLWIPVFCATGAGIYFMLTSEPSKWITLGLIESLILIAIIFRHYLQILRILTVLALIVGGFAWAQVNSIYISSKQAPFTAGKQYIKGVIKKIDYNQSGKLRLTLDKVQDFDNQNMLGRFRISLRNKKGNYKVGECVEMVATLMPRAKPQIPEGFKFDRNSFYQNISGSGYAESRALPIECRETPPILDTIHNHINNWRFDMIEKIYSTIPPEQASIVAAILVGEQSRISPQTIQNYRNSGLAHFLSISGLHMSMIAGLMFFFIRLIIALIPPLSLRYDSKKISAIMAIIVSGAYLLISGMAIPVQRAFIMTFIVLLGIILNRRAISMYTIAWAAFIVLFFTPQALISASFQMSFAAVIVLIAFYERFASKINSWFRDANNSIIIKTVKIICAYFVGIIIADFVASIATLPFAIYHFNRVATYTSLTNLIAGPIIGFIIMPFTLFSLLAMPFGAETYLLHIVGWGIGLLNNLTAWVSSLGGSNLQVMSMPLWGLMSMTFGGLWLCIWQREWRIWGMVGIVLGCLSFLTISKPDILINEDNSLVAIRDEQNNIVILPTRGKNFTKQIWLDKTSSKVLNTSQKILLKKILQGKTVAPKWLDLKCDNSICIYKKIVKIDKDKTITINGSVINASLTEGIAIYLSPKFKITGVNSKTNNRLWKQK
ncbi:MAG: ComEC/Rec2 family competence protein [Alphaproteobacteria bacterium]|nr:ComEC/Rec2 family competence protein [Alphaproteobacteria bacterium]